MRAYLTAVSAMALCVGLTACAEGPRPPQPAPVAPAPAPPVRLNQSTKTMPRSEPPAVAMTTSRRLPPVRTRNSFSQAPTEAPPSSLLVVSQLSAAKMCARKAMVVIPGLSATYAGLAREGVTAYSRHIPGKSLGPARRPK